MHTHTPAGYDIIGDIHGQHAQLLNLLAKMGYQLDEHTGAWQHATRQAIFAGDYIDRGSEQLAVLQSIKKMVDTGSAHAIMGNHELNAIGWHTPMPHQPGAYLRAHSAKNHRQHHPFLQQIGEFSPVHQTWVDWFKQLPLWLDLGCIRVVHAAWDQTVMAQLQGVLDAHRRVMPAHWEDVLTPHTPVGEAVELLLKGTELALPEGVFHFDKDGIRRNKTRIQWWAQGHNLPWTKILINKSILHQLPPGLPSHYSSPGYTSQTPLFIGHYALPGQPHILTPHLACVDYCAGSNTPLCAYRWSGETTLSSTHFVRCD